MANQEDKRSRNWTVVLYPDDLPDDWLDKLRSIKVQIILSPLHDKDTNADNTPKKPHYHAMLMFTGKKSSGQVFGLLQSVFGSVFMSVNAKAPSIPGVATINEQCRVHDKQAMVRYFAHLDNPEKYQYDPGEMQGLNGADVAELLKRSLTEMQDELGNIMQFIVDNNITEFCDLCMMARTISPEWFLICTTKSTYFLTHFIQSFRNKQKDEMNAAAEPSETAEGESENA